MRNALIKILSLSVCLILSSPLYALGKEGDREKSMRLGMIGANQIGLSVDLGYWYNTHISMRLMYQFGSYRNLMNMYVGTGYSIRIPNGENRNIYLAHHLPIFIGAKINYYSWQRNCLYIGTETEYNVFAGVSPVSHGFWALSGNLGFRLQACDIHLKYTYDLIPAYNQKFIYESPDYNYYNAYHVIYERMHLGLGVSYYFTLGL